MTDIASLTIAVDSTSADKATKSLDNLTAASGKTEQATNTFKSANVNAWASLNVMTAAEDAAADKAWALANGYKEVGGQIVKASATTENAAGLMTKLGLNTQFAQREMMLLGKEAVTGEFSRIPRTLGTLATHSNILPALISPIGLAIAGVTAAAAAGAYAWYHWGDAAAESSKRVHDAAKEAEKDSKTAWASVKRTIDEDIIAVQNQIAGATGQLQAAQNRNRGVTGNTSAKDSAAIGDEVINRKSQINALERNLADLLKQRQDIQNKLDEKQGVENLKRITELNKLQQAHAKEYEDAVSYARIVDIEISSNVKLTASQKKLVELLTEQENGTIALTQAEFARQAGNLSMRASAEITAQDYIEKQKLMDEAAKKSAKASQEHWKTFADNTQRTMSDVFFDGMTGKYNDIEKMFSDMLLRMLANATAARLSEAIFGTSGSGSSSNGWIGTALMAFGGGKATGGTVNSGTTYLVGEKGPELFTPGTSGNITPNNALGGSGVTMNNNYVINVDARADRQQTIQEVSKMIDNKQAQQEDRLRRMGAITA